MTKFLLKLTTCLLCCLSIESIGQNLIDRYLTDPLTYTIVGTAINGLDQPTDLDFKPNSKELWVVNHGSNGGSNVIFYNAGQNNQFSQYQKDSHTSHFMTNTSAMAFSDI